LRFAAFLAAFVGQLAGFASDARARRPRLKQRASCPSSWACCCRPASSGPTSSTSLEYVIAFLCLASSAGMASITGLGRHGAAPADGLTGGTFNFINLSGISRR
jgi:hypothetical protein